MESPPPGARRVAGGRWWGGGSVQLGLLLGGQFRGEKVGQDHGAGQVGYFLIADAPPRRGPPCDRFHGDGRAVGGRAQVPVITPGSPRVWSIRHAHAIPGPGPAYTALACTFLTSG